MASRLGSSWEGPVRLVTEGRLDLNGQFESSVCTVCVHECVSACVSVHVCVCEDPPLLPWGCGHCDVLAVLCGQVMCLAAWAGGGPGHPQIFPLQCSQAGAEPARVMFRSPWSSTWRSRSDDAAAGLASGPHLPSGSGPWAMAAGAPGHAVATGLQAPLPRYAGP